MTEEKPIWELRSYLFCDISWDSCQYPLQKASGAGRQKNANFKHTRNITTNSHKS